VNAKPLIISDLKWIWMHRLSIIKGTNPLFIIIKSIIIIITFVHHLKDSLGQVLHVGWKSTSRGRQDNDHVLPAFRFMKYLCTPYPQSAAFQISTGLGNLPQLQMQDKGHAQAQGKHTQAGAGHARTNSPRKHNTRLQVQVSANTDRRTNAQTRAG